MRPGVPALDAARFANAAGSWDDNFSRQLNSTLAASYARPPMASGSDLNFSRYVRRNPCSVVSGLSSAQWLE